SGAGARKALRDDVGVARLRSRHSRRLRHRPRRSERRGQDDAAEARCRTDTSERREHRGARLLAARRRARTDAPDRVRRAGSPAPPTVRGGRNARARAAPQPDVERRARARAPRAPPHSARPQGRQALGRPAGPGRTHSGAREAARAAPARRAGCVARPARTARVPEHGDGSGERVGGDRGALVAHRRRPRAGVRSPRHPLGVATAARRLDRRRRREPSAAHRSMHRLGGRRPRARRHPREPYEAADDAARARERPRVRREVAGARGRPRGDRARLPRLRRRRPRAQGGGVVIWLGWRQQRTETVIAAALLGFVAAFLVPTGIEMAHAYAHDGLANCLGLNTGPACGDAVSAFELRFSKFTGLVGWFHLVPGLFRVVLAAPYVVELDHGTHRLAWTQSITRFQWVRAKLALAITSTLVAAAALIALYTWWRVPFVHLDGRMDNGAFDAQGTVVLGYALFALGLALAVGAVWRRGIPAVLVSFVGYFVARIFVDTWLRQRFIAPKQLTFSSGRGDPPALWHA